MQWCVPCCGICATVWRGRLFVSRKIDAGGSVACAACRGDGVVGGGEQRGEYRSVGDWDGRVEGLTVVGREGRREKGGDGGTFLVRGFAVEILYVSQTLME